jgi:hypothetical protein
VKDDADFGAQSADVALHGFLVAKARFVGVLPEFPPGPPLAEQIPALIQHNLEALEPLAIGIGRGAMRLPLEQLVLLAR